MRTVPSRAPMVVAPTFDENASIFASDMPPFLEAGTGSLLQDEFSGGALNAKWIIDATKPVGLPFQKLADVPEDVWRNIQLDDYFANGVADAGASEPSAADVQPVSV